LAGRSVSRGKRPVASAVRSLLDVAAAPAGGFSLSPDGTTLAFAVDAESDARFGRHIAVRRLGGDAARTPAGTEGSGYPVFSPDSRRVAFFASGKLRVADLGGGPVQTICDAPEGRGGAWSKEGTIVFAPSYTGPLFQVSESGGVPRPVTRLDASRSEATHRF